MHNIIGIGIWWFWSKKRLYWESIPIFLILLGALGILFLGSLNEFALLYHPASMDINYYSHLLAGMVSDEWKASTVLLFAFLQSIHYLVWIRLIPEEDRKQPTPRGFRKSYDALRQDFGWVFLALCALGLLFFIGYALISPQLARTDYLTLISFHGFLELSMLAYQSQGKKDDMDNGFSAHAGD